MPCRLGPDNDCKKKPDLFYLPGPGCSDIQFMCKEFKIIFSVVLFLISMNLHSQVQEEPGISNVTRATFFAPGISYEKKIGKFQSMCAQAFLGTSFYIGYSSSLGTTADINLYPSLGLQYRYYYNAAKRQAEGKRTEMNSLNYLAAVGETAFYQQIVSADGNKDIRSSNVFGVAWGISRNYLKRFSLDLSIGLGYFFTKTTTVDDLGQYITENEGGITNVGHIGLGFWLNKRK